MKRIIVFMSMAILAICLMVLILKPSNKTTEVVVKVGGTVGENCDFTNIKDALDSITNNKKDNNYVIKVMDGIYEINDFGVPFLGIKSYVDIVGQSKTGVIIKHTAETMDATKATFDVGYYGDFDGECTLKNMTVISFNCKSPFHFDADETAFKGTITIEDCILINQNKFEGEPNHNCVACGLRPGQNIHVKNCIANGFIWAHNSTIDNPKGASFIVENTICEYLWVASLGSKTKDVCKFINNKCEYIKLDYADHMKRSNTDDFEMSWAIELENNDFNYIETLYENASGEVLGDFWDALYGGKVAITDLSIHDYCYNDTGLTLKKGTYVDMDDSIAKTITTAKEQTNAYGVVLKDIPSGAYGVVQYDGDFLKALSNGSR